MNDRIALFNRYKKENIVVVSTSSLYTSMIEQSAVMYYQETHHKKNNSEDSKSYEGYLHDEEMFYINNYELGKSDIFDVSNIQKFIAMIQAIEGDTLGYIPDYTFFISHAYVKYEFMDIAANNLNSLTNSDFAKAFLESYIQFSKGTYISKGKSVTYTPFETGCNSSNGFNQIYITNQNCTFSDINGQKTSKYSEDEIFADLLAKFESNFYYKPSIY